MVLIFIFLAGGFVAVDFRDDPLFWNSVACSGESYAALSGVGDVCRVFESWDLFFELNFLLRKNIPPGSASWALKPKERETCRDVLFINLITNYSLLIICLLYSKNSSDNAKSSALGFFSRITISSLMVPGVPFRM